MAGVLQKLLDLDTAERALQATFDPTPVCCGTTETESVTKGVTKVVSKGVTKGEGEDEDEAKAEREREEEREEKDEGQNVSESEGFNQQEVRLLQLQEDLNPFKVRCLIRMSALSAGIIAKALLILF